MPWDSGDEHLAIFRRYVKAKVRLIGLVDRLSKRAAAKVRRAGRRRWRATVDLRGLPKRRVVVRIRSDRAQLPSRVYRTCARRHPR